MLIPNCGNKCFFLGLRRLWLIVTAISLWGNPLCRWPWWMFPVGGEFGIAISYTQWGWHTLKSIFYSKYKVIWVIVGTLLTSDVIDIWSMSSSIHDMIYLISCKSIWGHPGFKMNILCGNMVLLMTRSLEVAVSQSFSIIISWRLFLPVQGVKGSLLTLAFMSPITITASCLGVVW